MIKNQDIEKTFIDELQLDKYVKEVAEQLKHTTFMEFNPRSVDNWVKSFFIGKERELETLIVRAFILGQFFAKTEDKINIKELPEETELVKLGSYEEAIHYVKTSAKVNLAGATDSTNIATRDIIFQEMSRGQDWRQIAARLTREIAEEGSIGRFWYRVAITEVSSAINNGYLSQKNVGDFVIGVGYDDACKYCKDMIIGKIFRIGLKPNYNFDDLIPGTKEYKEACDYYDKYVWIGKDNYGRSGAENKMVDGMPQPRLRHEKYVPTLPLHPSCRCRYLSFYPQLVFSDGKGNIIPRHVDEEKWREVTKKLEDKYNVKI
jgi:hypothetical protein